MTFLIATSKNYANHNKTIHQLTFTILLFTEEWCFFMPIHRHSLKNQRNTTIYRKIYCTFAPYNNITSINHL